jgi:uncharacterized protein (TIGR02246 family)
VNLPSADRAALEALVAELAQAWNAGDAARFAAQFAWDAEQVNIFGAQLHGRHGIEVQHDRIFKTVFLGSINALHVADARLVAADVLLARVASSVDVPRGPLQGRLDTMGSLVLLRTGARWEIVLFHNTRVAERDS